MLSLHGFFGTASDVASTLPKSQNNPARNLSAAPKAVNDANKQGSHAKADVPMTAGAFFRHEHVGLL